MLRLLRFIALLLMVASCSSAPPIVFSTAQNGSAVSSRDMFGYVQPGETEHYWQWTTSNPVKVLVWSNDFRADVEVWHNSGDKVGEKLGDNIELIRLNARPGTYTLRVKFPPGTAPGARYFLSLQAPSDKALELRTMATKTSVAEPLGDGDAISIADGRTMLIAFDPTTPLHPQLGVQFQRMVVRAAPGSGVSVIVRGSPSPGLLFQDAGGMEIRGYAGSVDIPDSGEAEVLVFVSKRGTAGQYEVNVSSAGSRAEAANKAFLATLPTVSPRPADDRASPPPSSAIDPKKPFTSESQETELKFREMNLKECNQKCRPHLEICVASCETFSSPRVCIADRCADSVAYCIANYQACADYCKSAGCRDISVLIP